jgi:hypothetical protein
MKDGSTPQPAYWIWLNHAQMEEDNKLYSSFSDPYTNVIATRNNTTNIIRLLTGRYLKSSPNDVKIKIVDYPYSNNVRVKIERVPNDANFYTDPPKAKAMPEGPILIENKIIQISDDLFEIDIDNYIDGDAYILTIYPAPTNPNITGPLTAKPKTNHYYKFVSENPSRSDLYYYIDWGDGNSVEWIGPYTPSEEIIMSHSWEEKGSYIIYAKSKDEYELESEWGSLEVSIPKERMSINSIYLSFIDRFQNIKPLFLLFNKQIL